MILKCVISNGYDFINNGHRHGLEVETKSSDEILQMWRHNSISNYKKVKKNLMKSSKQIVHDILQENGRDGMIPCDSLSYKNCCGHL